MRSSALAGAWGALTGLFFGANADAFCRTTTCQNCPAPVDSCVTDGIPVHWAVGCISYDMQIDASKKWVDLDRASVVAGNAFDAWQNAVCLGTGMKPSLEFQN